MGKAILLSVVGFGGFLVVDIRFVRGRSWLRSLVLLVSSLALTSALWLTIAPHRGLLFSSPLAPVGLLLVILGAWMTVYTVFIEIPLFQRAAQTTLVQTGTYAICRHPAFWGILMFVTGMSLLVPVSSMWMLALLWVGLELALITVQDVWVFPTLFPEYRQYRKETPFVLPTRKSLREGWTSYTRWLWNQKR